MRNWKTTTVGILTIIGALISGLAVPLIQGQSPDATVLGVGILTGVGFILARDAKSGAMILVCCLAFGVAGCATTSYQLTDVDGISMKVNSGAFIAKQDLSKVRGTYAFKSKKSGVDKKWVLGGEAQGQDSTQALETFGAMIDMAKSVLPLFVPKTPTVSATASTDLVAQFTPLITQIVTQVLAQQKAGR